jgi:hypothetical protein
MNAPRTRPLAAAALCAALTAWAAPAQAQLVYRDFHRVDQSDVTGLSMTTADMLGLEAAPVRSFSCTVAWGVRTSATSTARSLERGTVTGAAVGSRALRTDVQRDLHALLYGRGSGMRVAAGLAPTGSSREAELAAVALVRALDGLFSSAERMDPARPGIAAPTRLSAAIAAWDDYLDASTVEFLSAPTDELLAVHAVLTELVNGAITNHGRVETVAAPGGLACAGVMGEEDFTPLDSSISEESRPFAMCTVHEAGPVQVYGLITSSGDSLAIVEGAEHPLRDAYPAATPATESSWYHGGADLMLGRERYVKYGSTREMIPGSVTLFTRHEGVNVYAAPGVPRPSAVFLPVGGCVFHEYRLARTSSNARG